MIYNLLNKLKFLNLVVAGILMNQTLIYGQGTIGSNEKVVTGLDFGILPSFVYNQDRGLQYGALANFYYYGDGKIYPEYLFNLYLQSSRTTKKGYVNYLFFDSKHLLPFGMRLTIDMAWTKKGFQEFYGFNGFNSQYNSNFINPASQQFISKHYYYLEENVKKISIDVHGRVPLPNFIWDLGFSYYDISTLPKKKPDNTTRLTLFEKYMNSGVIPQNQKNGGVVFYYKLGLIYDTRDNESIPTKGFWIEGIYTSAPAFLTNKFPYSMATFKVHQYISLSSKLVFTYRLSYQMKMNGNIPFYMLPYFMDSYQVQDALGGSKTIRGVLARRLIGNGFALANIELRYIPFSTILLQRNVGIGFNLFDDVGIVTQKYPVDKTIDGSTFDYKSGLEKLHHGVGLGTRLIINHNFIVSLDYGMALDKRDGKNSFYLDLDYLF